MTSRPAPSSAWTAILSSPAVRPSASIRAGTSSAEFAWIVPHPPSWPVLSADSNSTISGPRTSPTTMRSGLIRSDWRTSSRIVIAPTPSIFANRD